MKKMGDLYGFPVAPPGTGNQPPGANIPGQSGSPSQPGSWPGQGQGQLWPDQGQPGWAGGTNQGWPAGNPGQQGQGQGQPWPDQTGAQGWPDQQPSGAGRPQGPAEGRPGSQNNQPGRPGAGSPGTGAWAPAGQGVGQPGTGADGQTWPQGPRAGSLEDSHPRSPKPKYDHRVRMFNGSIHSRHPCHLHPWSSELHHDIRTKVTYFSSCSTFPSDASFICGEFF